MNAQLNKWCTFLLPVMALFILLTGQAKANGQVGLYADYLIPGVKPIEYHRTPFPYANPYPHPYPTLWKHALLDKSNSKMQTFLCPVLDGKRLDYCFMSPHRSEHYCGRAAANAYCQKMGYRYATRFYIEKDVGETRNIFDGYVMKNMSRDGFKKIRCRT